MFRKADRQDLQNIPAMLSAIRIRLDTLGEHDKLIIAAMGVIENHQGKLLAALNVVETVCDALRDELGEAREAGRNSNTALSGQISGGFDGLVDVISLLPSKVFREFQARVTPEYAKPMAAKAKRPAKRRSRKP